MDYRKKREYGNGEIRHGYPIKEGSEINTRRNRKNYSNHEKAVTQPTPSSDKKKG